MNASGYTLRDTRRVVLAFSPWMVRRLILTIVQICFDLLNFLFFIFILLRAWRYTLNIFSQ